MELTLFSSSFCEPCIQTRAVLAEAERLVPQATVRVLDVANYSDEAEANGIRSTPTVVVKNDEGTEVFRAVGVPTLAQVLVAAAKAL
jgi:thiol-disulfide isomerase/thioredoxin